MNNIQQFLNIARYMCLRPGMYTPTGTYNELLAALHGFEMGLFPADSSPLFGFSAWLALTYSVPKQTFWFCTLRTCEGDAASNPQWLWELLVRYFREAHQIEVQVPQIEACCGYAGVKDHGH